MLNVNKNRMQGFADLFQLNTVQRQVHSLSVLFTSMGGVTFTSKLCGQIVQQFKSRVSQQKTARNLGISPSTIHYIIKRLRESREDVRNKTENQHCTPVTFDPSGCTEFITPLKPT